MLIYYDLEFLYGIGRSNPTSDASTFFAQLLIKSNIGQSFETIQRNFRLWSTRGARYNGICVSLEDKGAPFLLPWSVSDHM